MKYKNNIYSSVSSHCATSTLFTFHVETDNFRAKAHAQELKRFSYFYTINNSFRLNFCLNFFRRSCCYCCCSFRATLLVDVQCTTSACTLFTALLLFFQAIYTENRANKYFATHKTKIVNCYRSSLCLIVFAQGLFISGSCILKHAVISFVSWFFFFISFLPLSILPVRWRGECVYAWQFLVITTFFFFIFV